MSRHFGGLNAGRQSDRTRIFIVLGVVVTAIFSVVAFLALYSGASASSAPAAVVVHKQEEPLVKMIDVLVPVQDIDSGMTLDPAMFRRESRPQVGVSPKVIRDFEEIKGQFARSLIVSGQPLQRDYVTSVRPTNAITANIPEGWRAITISVDARSAVEGWVRPGARVDVVWVSNIRGQPGVTVIVQNAKILSAERQTDAKVNPGAPVPSTVTLLISSQDASKIQLAQTTGSLTLQLRGDNDPKGSNVGSVTVKDLFGNGEGDNQRNDCSGSVTMGGIRYCIKPDGKLEPME